MFCKFLIYFKHFAVFSDQKNNCLRQILLETDFNLLTIDCLNLIALRSEKMSIS